MSALRRCMAPLLSSSPWPVSRSTQPTEHIVHFTPPPHTHTCRPAVSVRSGRINYTGRSDVSPLGPRPAAATRRTLRQCCPSSQLGPSPGGSRQLPVTFDGSRRFPVALDGARRPPGVAEGTIGCLGFCSRGGGVPVASSSSPHQALVWDAVSAVSAAASAVRRCRSPLRSGGMCQPRVLPTPTPPLSGALSPNEPGGGHTTDSRHRETWGPMTAPSSALSEGRVEVSVRPGTSRHAAPYTPINADGADAAQLARRWRVRRGGDARGAVVTVGARWAAGVIHFLIDSEAD